MVKIDRHYKIIQLVHHPYEYFKFKIFTDIHLQNVTMCFRGIGNFEIIKPIPGVGCRIKKDYFQVTK